MTYAENKFNTMKRDHKWNSLSPDQEKVVALSTTIRELQDTNLKLATAFKSQSKKSNKKGKSNSDKWAWKKDPPKDSDPKTKNFDNKTYYWCHKHQMWTLHKPSGCKLKHEDQGEEKSDNSSTSHGEMMAVILEDIEEEENEEGGDSE